MNTAELLRKAWEESTPGEWRWEDYYSHDVHAQHKTQGLDAPCENIKDGRVSLESDSGQVLAYWAEYAADAGLSITRANMEFIVAAHKHVPALLEENARLREMLAHADNGCPQKDGAPGGCFICAEIEALLKEGK